jgi:hypothetical protein
MSFYFFVRGYINRNKEFIGNKKLKGIGIREGIRQFIDEYELLEYGYSENQLRRLFYSYKTKGVLILFQHNIQLNIQRFL